MTTATLTKETTELAVKFFEAKLAFETGPVGLNQWINNKEKVQVIDLRTPELYAKGHIPTAVNVSYDELEQYASKLDKEVNTVVYCYDITCHLSAKAALLLAKKGQRVQELLGGYQSWTEKQYNVEAKNQAEASSCASTKHSCG
jgi:rhodanese-related sulfurtransferase